MDRYATYLEDLKRLEETLKNNESLSSKAAGVFGDIFNLNPFMAEPLQGSNTRVARTEELKKQIEQEKQAIMAGKRDYSYDPKQYPQHSPFAGVKNTPEFLDRINNPEKYPFIKNEDGSISTHQMAAEVDEQGNWFVFPTIVRLPNGKLHKFENTQEAMNYNLRMGNFLPMKSKKEALKYAEGGYKKGTPLEKFNPLQKQEVEDILSNPFTKGL